MLLTRLSLGLVVVTSAAVALRGQEIPEVREVDEPQGQPGNRKPATTAFEHQHATGDWGGFRSWLEEHGVVPELLWTVDGSVVAGGGIDPGGTALRSLWDATLEIDGATLFGWQGATFFADLQIQRGPNGSDDVGDLQTYSNIDSDNRTQLAELFYAQHLFDDALRFKVGKIDANVDFAFVEHGFAFVNSSFGFSPTILGFPTYPDGSFGASTLWRPGDGWFARAGVYDGAAQAGFKTGSRGLRTLFGSPADLFVIGEVGRRWRGDEALGAGRVGLGAYHHTGDFLRFDGGVESGTAGAYLVLDQLLWQPEDAGESGRGVGAFCQYGWADQHVSPIAQHVGAGATWTGPTAMRPHDQVGLGATWVAFSDEPGAGLSGDSELAVELFYALQLTPWVNFKPDVQYIHNPGGAGLDDALVLTMRMTVIF